MFIQIFIVFSLVLLLTRSRLLACQREFVIKQYQFAKSSNQLNWWHKIWHALWTCPMCSGFWFSLFVTLFWGNGFIGNTLALFGINWLLHCLEDALFNAGQYFEKRVEYIDQSEHKTT